MAIIISYPASANGIIVLLKTPLKCSKLDYNKNKKAQKITQTPAHFCRSWYNGSYTMMIKPIKTLELHYPMIQFLINLDIAAFQNFIIFVLLPHASEDFGRIFATEK